MNLLFWRHAEAEDFHSRGDLARRLTEHGRTQAVQGAHWIHCLARAHDWKLQVAASPAQRTRQTAAALGVDVEIDERLAPDADPAQYLERAQSITHRREALVLVGHQPIIGEAIAELLIGSPCAISVRKGGIWWFSIKAQTREDAPAALRGVWTPD